ncbi:TerC family protein [Paenibacillus ginsengarvi]|uniref:TerC family protein n=1 Tax=Paenibacillus ginsengarvi TaxID=400777 RepID=A0A3B0CLR0_9BACL|nr:TerC family protein [Paenibacillus ginsengarvi]RKN85801.1 TerC family protein [Paenibacillus ginsengarvi]
MEWFTGEMLSALLMIIVIDLVLAGDNAIVIGMAARNLPKEQQKKAIIWGTVGAVVIRAVATLAVVWLLAIPGLLLVGGLFLVWIAIKLLTEEKNHDNVKAGTSLGAAIRTIVIADAVMGIDNILAVAGAAHGSFALVVVGLAISVPVMVWGSTLVLKLIERFPATMYIGAAVLALTSAKMIVDEKFIKAWIGEGVLKWTIVAVIVVIVMGIGMAIKKSRASKSAEAEKAAGEPFKAS